MLVIENTTKSYLQQQGLSPGSSRADSVHDSVTSSKTQTLAILSSAILSMSVLSSDLLPHDLKVASMTPTPSSNNGQIQKSGNHCLLALSSAKETYPKISPICFHIS